MFLKLGYRIVRESGHLILSSSASCCDGRRGALNCVLSPSTRYRELALGPALFHWESQSTTTAVTGAAVCAGAAQAGDGQRTVRVPGICHLREPRRRATDGDPLAVGAGDSGGVAAGAGGAGLREGAYSEDAVKRSLLAAGQRLPT